MKQIFKNIISWISNKKLPISIFLVSGILLIICQFKSEQTMFDKEIIYKNQKIEYRCNYEIMTIKDSYKYNNEKEMHEILDIITKNNDVIPNNRTIEDMMAEWKAHNLLYKWHIFRKRTKDVDFEGDQSKIIKFIYSMLAKI